MDAMDAVSAPARRRRSLKKKTLLIILGVVNAVMLTVIIVCLLQIRDYAGSLRSQQAAELWRGQGDSRFAQVSAFLPVGKEVDESAVFGFRSAIEPKLRDAGIEPPETGSLWTDAYSGFGSLEVSGPKGTYSAGIVGVGGDFFLFHPFELLSGSYISEDDIMKDRVVLDHELAWKLFGGSDLEGMSVTIGGKPYYIAGVVRRETDGFSTKAFTGEPLVFMFYSTAAESISDFKISCYELVMPDPISDFASTFLFESFASKTAVTVQNTDRFGFGGIYGLFKDFGSRSVHDTGVAFPYWENAARVAEDYIARLYVAICFFGFVPALCLIWLAILFGMFLSGRLKYGWTQGKEAWDDRYARIDNIKTRSKRRKVERKREKALPEEQSPDSYNEQAVVMDIESIVREIMEEDK